MESAAYLVDASWCNEHNGDGQLQRNMAAFSLDSVAVDSNHIIVLPSDTKTKYLERFIRKIFEFE